MRPILFIDDGGVMHDHQVRPAEWRRLLGQFFPPLLGGTAEAWAEANRLIFEPLMERENRRIQEGVYAHYGEYLQSYLVDWLRDMCRVVGVSAPSKVDALQLAHQAQAYVTRRVRSAIPGVADTIRTLHGQGYTLHTASGEGTDELTGYLEAVGVGVRECFGRLYGPDLVYTFKHGPEYYRRIFADSGVDPADCLVVDDSPEAVVWAQEVGATAVLISPEPAGDTVTLRRLADLPALLERF